MNRTIIVPDDGLWIRGAIRTDDGNIPAYHIFRMGGVDQEFEALLWLEARTRLTTREFSLIVFNAESAREFGTMEDPKLYPSIEDDRIIFSSVSSIGETTGHYVGVYPYNGVPMSVAIVMVFPLRKRNVKVDYAIRFGGAG